MRDVARMNLAELQGRAQRATALLKAMSNPVRLLVLCQLAEGEKSVGELEKSWKQSELPLIVKGYGLDYPDALNILQLYYGPNGSPGSNDANYKDPEFDRLFDQASVLPPSPERTALVRRMNERLIDDCVTISGLSRLRVYLWHRDVVALPDREIVGGYFLKYVDLADGPAEPVAGGDA